MDYLELRTKASNAFLTLLFVLMIVPIQTSGAEGINIEINEKSEIEKEEILLGDVGRVKGNDKNLVKQINDIVLGRIPLAEERRKIDKDLIIIRLKQSDIDPTKINILVPDDAIVTRKSIDISNEDIKKIVLDFLHKRLQLNGDKVNITNIRVGSKITLPKGGDISCKVIPPKNKELLGATLLSLEFSVNGQFQKKVFVTVDIEVIAKVVVTKRPLGRYKLITEDDIQLVDMNLAKLSPPVIMSSKDVLGKRTRRAIDSNAVLNPDLIEFPPLVKKGEIVLISVESEGLKVTALGRVKEHGSKGQMVRVENIDSAKEIYARIMDSNNVKVDF